MKFFLDENDARRAIQDLNAGMSKLTVADNFKKEKGRLIVEVVGDVADGQMPVYDADNAMFVAGTPSSAMAPARYDPPPEFVYTGGVLTSVVYKLGGVVVRTVTLNYTDGNLTSLTVS